MSASSLRATARVSPMMSILIRMAGSVDSYWSKKELGLTFNDVMMQLSEEERSAFALIQKGLHRLFPFDPDRDDTSRIVPRHVI